MKPSQSGGKLIVAASLMVLLVAFFFAGCKKSGGGNSGSSSAGSSFSAESTAPVITSYNCGAPSILSSGDPIAGCAWHLQNTGQSAFSQNNGSAGFDINMIQSETDGYTGSGIKIAISDTGLEIAHEDLAANIEAGASRNYSLSPPYTGDPTNYIDTDGDHGTSVAGLIGAVKGNQKGSRGVASTASLAGLNFLNSTQTTAMLIDQANGSSFDIFNQSWGSTGTASDTLDSNYLAQLRYGVITLRAGKGAIYVRATGNNYAYGLPGNVDPYNTTPYTINAAATNATGVASSYSSNGPCTWVSAPGGEFGTSTPAVITTDQSSCTKGYSQPAATKNNFEKGLINLNQTCNYTSGFNGTSSATPVVSGVVALMLHAKPTLTWRDVKHILASTSRQIHATAPNITAQPVAGLSALPVTHVWDYGWITNGAGYKFHNRYGFGLIDADAAVNMAKTYAVNLGTYVDTIYKDALTLGDSFYDSGTISKTIPDNSATGVTDTLNVGIDLTIESVQVKLSATHAWPNEMGIELTSPLGTKSVLLNINNKMTGTNLNNMILLSNAFYGESATGSWTIKLIDGVAFDTGKLTNWQLIIAGRSGTFTGVNLYCGGDGTVGTPYQVCTPKGLQWINKLSSKYFELSTNLDMTGYAFTAIPTFTGVLDGKGFAINNLTVNRGTSYPGALIDGLSGATVKDIVFSNVSLTGNRAGLMGVVSGGSTIQDIRITSGTINGTVSAGALAANGGATILRCSSAATVSGISDVGGLVGLMNTGSISKSKASGAVVLTTANGGGLVGHGINSAAISNSYATGSVSGGGNVGGLVGHFQTTGGSSIVNSYSTGSVTGSTAGGFMAINSGSGTITSCHWDTTTSGQAASAVGTGHITADMKAQATFAGWDFTTIWSINEGVSYPKLLWEP